MRWLGLLVVSVCAFGLLGGCGDGNSTAMDGNSAGRGDVEPSGSFVSVWRIESAGESITLPLPYSREELYEQEVPFKYDFEVDWGDGSASSTVTSFDDPDRVHTYAAAGDYTVTITGLMETIYFNRGRRGGDKDKLIAIPNLGSVGWKSFRNAFEGCSNLGPVAGGDTSSVTDMGLMFYGATSANPDVSRWDTSSVTDMGLMFYGATSANPDVSGWDTSNVTTMGLMFYDAPSANPDTSNWDTSNVTRMDYMFYDATSANPDTSNWDTSRVSVMTLMFSGATSVEPQTLDWWEQQCARADLRC